jgi:hypothetical protein
VTSDGGVFGLKQVAVNAIFVSLTSMYEIGAGDTSNDDIVVTILPGVPMSNHGSLFKEGIQCRVVNLVAVGVHPRVYESSRHHCENLLS